MSEQNNDRLEEFFRKAAARADVSFNEDDWKKLEARLDARDAAKGTGGGKPTKLTATLIIGTMLLVGTSVWLGFRSDLLSSGDAGAQINGAARPPRTEHNVAGGDKRGVESGRLGNGETTRASRSGDFENGKTRKLAPSAIPGNSRNVAETDGKQVSESLNPADHEGNDGDAAQVPAAFADNTILRRNSVSVMQVLPSEQIYRDLIRTPFVRPEGYKQKAVVELPGAEEEKTREVGAMVEEEELASDQTRIMATPRLSLLLSFAPDFSGTSPGKYSAPGKAFGAMIHYHPLPRWSLAAGVIQNKKQYTGDGEDYKPPKGYWKYYTNGIIPETVDGSCSILEFPVMIQYTIRTSAKSRWLIGSGTSSYLMQNESYEYNFGQPNPGAKERWDSYRSSHFMFNMINFSISYERQVLPGLMLGIEPYAKIPLEEIGWSNLRLFSSGASVTLRYTVLRRQKHPITPGRQAPDG